MRNANDKPFSRSIAKALERLPNVGPATAADLVRLGVERAADLRGRDPDAMFTDLCELDGVRHDVCVRDLFEAAIQYVELGAVAPWWEYTRKRRAANEDQGRP